MFDSLNTGNLFEQRRRLLKGFAAAGLVGGLGALFPGAQLLAAGNREEQAYQLGMAAYVYGYPLIYFARMRYQRMSKGDPMTGQRHRYGAFLHRRNTVTPTVPGMPQTDTLYSNLWADLRNEPMLVRIPPIASRYWSLHLNDLFGVTFGVANRRDLPGGGALIALVGPNWKGTLPNEVAKVYRAPSPLLYTVLRLYFDNDADRQNVIALQDEFQAYPLSAYGQTAWVAPESSVFQPLDVQVDPLADFKTLQLMLRECPPPASEASLVGSFANIGLGATQPLDFSALDAETRRGLMRAEADGRTKVIAAAKALPGQQSSNGWVYPQKNAGIYGDDYLYRASTILLGTVVLPITENIYLVYQKDQTGQLLDGNARYTVTFPDGKLPEAEAFWSIHLYRYEGYTVIPNPIDRYSVGNRSDLRKDADGSLTLYLQATDPGGEKSANWLPTQAGKPFMMILRGYEPKGRFAAMTWPGPKVVRA
ncbi:DUF1254 domain-containing protein [Pseudomonas sp. H9]|uniref:DUF1254 domain-containing protein n=1 Tax=Pseudomonas sp. H9 TaxID=483968 RepID=UPI0014049D2D|nr:DUF1214 domain-containing protein [Pseudomonas sp. H9]